VTPQLNKVGAYLIFACGAEDFTEEHSTGVIQFLASDLVVERINEEGSGPLEVRVLSGQSGKPVSGATVVVYLADYQKGAQRFDQKLTDAQGLVHFSLPNNSSRNLFVVARKGEQLAVDSGYIYYYRNSQSQSSSGDLVYTDRSIYRPGQRIEWKVIS